MDQRLTEERVVEVATRIFAGLGYDMTSLEIVANALGVPTARLKAVVGDKRELYLRVMERVFEAKRARIQEVVDRVECEREAVYRIAEAYLDFYVENPGLVSLWMHRWACDAAEIADVEDRYLRPLARLASRKIGNAVPGDLGPHALLGVVLWCVNGFLGSGLLAPGRGVLRADDFQAVKNFRAILHGVIDRMLTPPPEPGAVQASGALYTSRPSA